LRNLSQQATLVHGEYTPGTKMIGCKSIISGLGFVVLTLAGFAFPGYLMICQKDG